MNLGTFQECQMCYWTIIGLFNYQYYQSITVIVLFIDAISQFMTIYLRYYVEMIHLENLTSVQNIFTKTGWEY